ncbi:hypothetical protein C7M84_016504 [Penaeus vannamei]|uniref:Uncharacterized protein n=1 Tax=Penaeus vannamei TaxID=6689 RepID=A0A423SMZ0_PENVA|nr:hypothetical protein C7M84_016504 [Penaeus vannamei]
MPVLSFPHPLLLPFSSSFPSSPSFPPLSSLFSSLSRHSFPPLSPLLLTSLFSPSFPPLPSPPLLPPPRSPPLHPHLVLFLSSLPTSLSSPLLLFPPLLSLTPAFPPSSPPSSPSLSPNPPRSPKGTEREKCFREDVGKLVMSMEGKGKVALVSVAASGALGRPSLSFPALETRGRRSLVSSYLGKHVVKEPAVSPSSLEEEEEEGSGAVDPQTAVTSVVEESLGGEDEGEDDHAGTHTDAEEAESQPEPKAEPEPETKAEPEPEPEVKSEPEPEPEAEAEPKASPEPEPEATSEPEPEPKSEVQLEPEPEAEPKATREPEPETAPEPEPKTKAEEGEVKENTQNGRRCQI